MLAGVWCGEAARSSPGVLLIHCSGFSQAFPSWKRSLLAGENLGGGGLALGGGPKCAIYALPHPGERATSEVCPRDVPHLD